MPASIVAVLTAVLLLAGCSGAPPRVDYDDSYDFSAVQTFAMETRKRSDQLNPEISDLTYDRIEDALIDTLRGLGLTRVGKQDDPDLVVNYAVVTHSRQDVWDYAPPYDYTCYHCTAAGTGTEAFSDDYKVGTLYVDLVDPVQERAVWRGVASERVKEKRTPRQRRKLIEGIIENMFSTFPPATRPAAAVPETDTPQDH